MHGKTKKINTSVAQEKSHPASADFAAYSRDCIAIASQPDFWDKANALMKIRHWNPEIFSESTQLDYLEWRRFVTEVEKPFSDRYKLPTLLKAMAICIGLDIAPDIAESLLASAGHVLTLRHDERALHFALTAFRGDIVKCNDFLESQSLKTLGSKDRDKKSSA